jgi:RNA polymerase sigma factor (sigma-70 family)
MDLSKTTLRRAVQDPSRDRVMDDLYQANHAAVSRVCSSILRNADDAADATQEVFVIALESLDPAAKKAAARAWLITVARNYCLDLLRRRKRLGKALVRLGPDSGGTDMETAVADRDFVDVVFKQLSTRERQALWQSAVESRPLADIAGRLQLSYMAAAQVLHRARRHAVQVATRVAVVFGIVQLGRHRPGFGGLGAAQRFAALAAVPLIVVSMNASSPATQAASASAAPQEVVSNPVANAPNTGAGTESSAGLQPSPSAAGGGGQGAGLTPAGSTATLNSATDALGQLLRRLPSVPPGAAKPVTVPTVPALPSPPPIP